MASEHNLKQQATHGEAALSHQGSAGSSSGESSVPVRTPTWGPPWIAPIHRCFQIDGLWLMVAVVMLMMGVIFFGWRGLLGVANASLVTLLTYSLIVWVCRWAGWRIVADSNTHALVMGLLLGLCLPVTWGSVVPVVAGLMMGVVLHIVGRSHRVRAHPVAVVIILLWGLGLLAGGAQSGSALFGMGVAQPRDAPHAVLRAGWVVVGDVLDVGAGVDHLPWVAQRESATGDAMARVEPYSAMISHQHRVIQDGSILASTLGNGGLPPMGDLVLGAVPGAIGASGRLMLIVLGLYAIYRRVARWPVAVSALGAAVWVLLLMPVGYHDQTTVVLARLIHLGPSVAVSYLGYMVLASPLALIAMILAPQTAPTSSRGRVVYGAMIGAVMILLQWFAATPMAGMLSLLLASCLSRPLDAMHRSRFGV
jgi:Na+-translocating ferredoxin:NAD+ oxidoreductase RnfD subunit